MKRLIVFVMSVLLASSAMAKAPEKSDAEKSADGYLALFVLANIGTGVSCFVRAEHLEDRNQRRHATGFNSSVVTRKKAARLYHEGIACALGAVWGLTVARGVIRGYYDGKHGWFTFNKSFGGKKK